MAGRKYIDVAANLTDGMFKGLYNHNPKQYHSPDLDQVLIRAKESGVEKIIITGSSYSESKFALEICKENNSNLCGNVVPHLFSTVGVHPCNTMEFENPSQHGFNSTQDYLNSLKNLAIQGKQSGFVKAFGEIGLDYDRLNYASKDIQKKYFKQQLEIAVDLQLPLFLHSRAAADDFKEILTPYLFKLPNSGLVHSFTGTIQEMKDLLSLGLSIGINGCSLKTDENLKVVKEIPLDKLMLETDAPWCEIRPSHSSFKYLDLKYPLINSTELDNLNPSQKKSVSKPRPLPYNVRKSNKFQFGDMVNGRCEPCSIQLVAQVVAKVKQVSLETVMENAWNNSIKMFCLN